MTATDVQHDLRASARRLLARRSDSASVRAAMASPSGWDEGTWAELSAQGWPGIAVPEALGGAGLGWAEAAVLFEEAGSSLLCAPLLSTMLGIAAILEGGTPDQRSAHLPGLAYGSARATVALDPRDPTRTDLTLHDGRLSGVAKFVLDGTTADLLIVPALEGNDLRVVIVDATRSGIATRELTVLDQTRRLSDVTFDGVEISTNELLNGGEGLLQAIERHGVVLLASEQVGVASRALAEATSYAKTRIQFGLPIGTFQSIKHRLAEVLVRLEAARSVALHAAAALASEDSAELAIAAPMAKSLCSEVAWRATADNIQIHGGVGFTWEHDAHLAFKRAESSRHLFGEPERHRAALAQEIGLMKQQE